MCKLISILLIVFTLSLTNQASAASFTLNINIARQDDGTTCGELWYNQQVIWRLAFLADGAKPVSGYYQTRTTFIAPDIINGLFLIKIQ